MIRGTTAQFKFKMPYTLNELEWINVNFWQPNNPNTLAQIKKTKNDCNTTSNIKEIVVSLTAEETARFSDKYKARMQLRARHTQTGAVFGIKPQTITVYPMADDIAIDGSTVLPPDTDGWVVLDGGAIVED